MRSTLAPAKPLSTNTRAPASSSAARVAAWLSARVTRRTVTYSSVFGYRPSCEVRPDRGDGGGEHLRLGRQPAAVAVDHVAAAIDAGADGTVRANARRHHRHGGRG